MSLTLSLWGSSNPRQSTALSFSFLPFEGVKWNNEKQICFFNKMSKSAFIKTKYFKGCLFKWALSEPFNARGNRCHLTWSSGDGSARVATGRRILFLCCVHTLHSNTVNNWKKPILGRGGRMMLFQQNKYSPRREPWGQCVVLGRVLCPQHSCAREALLEGTVPAVGQDEQGWEM